MVNHVRLVFPAINSTTSEGPPVTPQSPTRIAVQGPFSYFSSWESFVFDLSLHGVPFIQVRSIPLAYGGWRSGC
jgi:hypothetical protein